jgi:GNAT superfamily N-acetyltransferase
MLFADYTLARRLEQVEAENVADYARTIARLNLAPGATVWQLGSGYAVYSGEGLPINRATNLGMNGPISPLVLKQIEEFYHARRAPSQVDLCPLADPSLNEMLGQQGYRILRMLNMLVRPLHPADAAMLPPKEVDVSRISPEEGEKWVQTVAQGFAGKDEADPTNLILAKAALNRPGVSCFLASVNGQLAGAAALNLRGNTATIFSTSTRPAFRNKGVQTALLKARISYAAGAGCDLMMVMATPGSASQRNLQRFGFQIAYTRLTLSKAYQES